MMRQMGFVLFFSVFFLVYIIANYYVFLRGWQGLSAFPSLKLSYTIIFIYLATAYLIMRFLGRFLPPSIDAVFYWSGSFWFATIFFLFLIIFPIDLIRIANHFLHFFPRMITENIEKARAFTTFVTAGLVFLLVLAGHINTLIPATRKLNLTIDKPLSGLKELKFALVSDMHMGTLIGKNRLERMVKKINSEHPDMVIFAGDLLDEIQEPIFRGDVGSPLRKLKAPFGIYAITGNHEYIGGVERAVKYIESLGVRMLRDTGIKVNGQFYLIGREDRSMGSFTGKRRKSLPELMQDVDLKYPVIVLDHQPFNFDDVVRNGADLQLSGHTHHGQFWPVSAMTKAIYELSWGYLKKGNTHFYVSNGFGTWGPPVRLGNRPEIVIIKLTNKTSN